MIYYLDNIPVAYTTDTLLNAKFTLRKVTETGDRAVSFTGDLTFTGKDAAYLKAMLVDDPNALENKVVFKAVDDCCDPARVYEFYITHKTLHWCDDTCDVTASADEKSISDDQYTCLQNTMIWDNYAGFKNRVHPRMAYCNELRPNWLHDVLIILIMATWTSFLTIGPVLIVIATIIVIINAVISVINIVINALNSLGASIGNMNQIDLDNDPTTNAYTEFDNWIKKLLNSSFGCGRKHPSPLVRDYIENVCTKCGLSFVSSIYNDPSSEYYWAVYVNAPINKGTEENDINTYWIEENQPIKSGLQFLQDLMPVHNAKFEISNSVLTFERRDFFVPKSPFLDLTTIDPEEITNGICWNWSSRTRYSYASFYYQKDSINWVGGEAIARWGDVVEWNNPYSSLQVGEYKPLVNFAACRFRDDGIDRDVLTFYNNLPTIGTVLRKYGNAMLMNSHNCYLPMLIIWDGQSTENAAADKFLNRNSLGIVGLNQAYNYPYWFNANYPGNLYDRFHAIENPRRSNFQGFDFEVEVNATCDLIRDMDVDGVVLTPKGPSQGPLTIIVNYENRTLTIKGTV